MPRKPSHRIGRGLAVFVLALACRAPAPETGEGPGEAKRSENTPACASDDDCVMSCVSETDCCTNPCGCDTVRHKDAHAAITAANEEYCADPNHACDIDVGGCDPRWEAATPRCRAGECVPELPPERQTAPTAP